MTAHQEVVVVGGGQAGLAMGFFLARQGRRFTILEAAGAPAAAWRARWDGLRLFTPVRYDSLPGLPFPGHPDSHPGRDDVVDYLSRYAGHFELPVRYGSRVSAIRPATGGGYSVELDRETMVADQVVVATGPFQVPHVPSASAALDPAIRQLHSADYRRPGDVPAGPVLVVGGGNTGFQIAEELAAVHETHLAIGSRQLPLPQRIAGRDVFRYLDAAGIMRVQASSRIGRRLREREALVGSSPRAARRRHGIRLHGRVVGAEGRSVLFADGGRMSPSAVVWATGFTLDHSFVHAPVLDRAGHIANRRGVTAAPGFYVLGLPWLHSRGSALLGWVKDDAEHLAGRIAEHAARSGRVPAMT